MKMNEKISKIFDDDLNTDIAVRLLTPEIESAKCFLTGDESIELELSLVSDSLSTMTGIDNYDTYICRIFKVDK